jgi:hypothetical protein
VGLMMFLVPPLPPWMMQQIANVTFDVLVIIHFVIIKVTQHIKWIFIRFHDLSFENKTATVFFFFFLANQFFQMAF